MIKYVKCPRCELNYIDPEKQEYCDVCIAEMKGNKLQFADFDEDYDDENAEKTEICPVCGVNTMRYGEKMCDACKQASQYEDDQDVDMDTDEEWKNYLEDDEDLTIDDETLEEELSELDPPSSIEEEASPVEEVDSPSLDELTSVGPQPARTAPACERSSSVRKMRGPSLCQRMPKGASRDALVSEA